jgi:hypothetical protein
MHASTKILLAIAIETLAASTSVIPYVGDRVGLLVTIVSLLIGGQLFGLSGMLLVFLRSLADDYRGSAFYRGAL